MKGGTVHDHHAHLQRVRIDVTGLSCPADAVGLERRLRRTPGLERVTVNPVIASVFATFDPDQVSLATLQDEIAWVGYGIRPAN